MLVKFWGVHGSLPRPGPKTLKYGGNTPCVELRCGATLIILDAGTGIRELGDDLLLRYKDASGKIRKIAAHIFVSHLHWDHVQGFPFFSPLFIKGNQFDLYGVGDLECGIRSTIAHQMAEPNFPLTLEDVPARVTFHNLQPGETITINDVSVYVEQLRHPGGSFGFRIRNQGKSLIYASDTEHLDQSLAGLVEFCQDADLLIYDSMFAPEQYLGLWDGIPRESWGHSTWHAAVELADAAHVKKLVLFHHGNTDEIVQQIEEKAREKFPETIAAYEGLEIKL